MKGKFVLVLLMSALCLPAFAGGVKGTPVTTPNYELAERFSAARVSKMLYSTRVSPEWFSDGDRFIYKWSDSEGSNYYLVDPKNGTRTAIFDNDKLAMRLTEITRDPYDADHLPFRSVSIDRKDERYLKFDFKSSDKKEYRFRYRISDGEMSWSTEKEESRYPRWACVSPDGTIGVYMKNSNIFYMDSTNLRKAAKDAKDSTLVEHRLTSDGVADFAYCSSSYSGNTVRDTTERSFPSDLVWSPDSRHFATIRWDMSEVKELWVINSLSNPRPTLETYKYQMPGEPSPYAYLYVFDISDGSSQKVKCVAFKDQDMEFERPQRSVAELNNEFRTSRWLGDEKGFYLTRRSRDLKKLDICYVGLGSDSTRTVISERMNTYVENRSLRPVAGGRQLLHWSERNGWANIYLYNSDGSLVRNLTEGAFHVEDVLRVNEKEGYMLVSACGREKGENPYQMHTYRVDLKTGAMKLLDMADMDVAASASESGKYFVANCSRVDHKPFSVLYDASGRKLMELGDADFSRLFAAGYKFPERFKVKAADGVTDLYGAMYKPYDFDSTRVYPICDYVYPGPQVEANNISWSSGFTRTDRLAQLGFIVITVGNRGGHPNRSKWYHNYGYGDLRDYGLDDQKYAIQQLGERYEWIDLDRVGIHGHSGGGFMSTAAILQYPDFFKVAVSCAGNHDNSIYNRWWSEQHHGIEEKVVASDTTFVYAIETNPEIASRLKGHLLLCTGDIDNNVHPANTIRVINALIRANKRFDVLLLPGQRHSFGDMNEYFFWKMADYYSEWLLGSSKRGEVDIAEMNNDRSVK